MIPRPYHSMNSVSLSRDSVFGEMAHGNHPHVKQWIAAAQRGDIAAFNHLVRAHQDMAYQTAHFLLDDPEAATGATQNAFVTASRTIRKCPREDFRIWFFRILLLECRRYENAAWSRPTIQAVRPSTLELGLATIPFDDRVVCVLSDIIGMSDQQIALVTRSPEPVTRRQRSRARRQLRDVIRLL